MAGFAKPFSVPLPWDFHKRPPFHNGANKMTQALRYDYCYAGVYSLDWPYCDSWGRVKKNKAYWNFRRRRASQVAEERKVNDDLLIEQTLAGDREAFGKLALKYQDRVFNLALPRRKYKFIKDNNIYITKIGASKLTEGRKRCSITN